MSHSRTLTPAEIAALPAGLTALLPEGVRLIDAHHPLSHLSKLFRGYGVILVRGRDVFWPGLPADTSRAPEPLSILAHELVHVWQYATGMTLFSYILRDVIARLGRYDYRLLPDKPYETYGYEQQAAMMEDWVRLRHGLHKRYSRDAVDARQLAAVIPFLESA